MAKQKKPNWTLLTVSNIPFVVLLTDIKEQKVYSYPCQMQLRFYHDATRPISAELLRQQIQENIPFMWFTTNTAEQGMQLEAEGLWSHILFQNSPLIIYPYQVMNVGPEWNLRIVTREVGEVIAEMIPPLGGYTPQGNLDFTLRYMQSGVHEYISITEVASFEREKTDAVNIQYLLD